MIAKGYFKTPRKIVQKMVVKLFEIRSPNTNDQILDPGCGPGDFIQGIIWWCNNNNKVIPKITGVELETALAQNAKNKFKEHSMITIEETDFLILPEKKYDFIIGNPPYVPITKLTEEEKKLYKPRFETAIERFDLYHLFFEKSLKSLKSGGRLVYVTPEKFIYTSTAKPLRRLLTSMQVREIEFLDERTFEGLTTYPTITVVDNLPNLEDSKITHRDGTVMNVRLPTNGMSWASAINGKVESDMKHRLKDVCKRISAGIATGADEIFVKKNNILPEKLKPFTYPTLSGKELIYSEESFNVTSSMLVPYDRDGKLIPFEELGALAKYFSQDHIVKRLKKRVLSKGKAWYSFHDSVPMKDILQPKIIFKDITIKPKFWIDSFGTIVPRHTVYYIVPKEGINIKEIFDYLMSDFAQDWMMTHCQRARGGFIRLQSNVLKEMPIPEKLYTSQYTGVSMIPEIEPYIFSEAVREFWKTRDSQAKKGVSDQGSRKAVTGGQQMNGFILKIRNLLLLSGASPSEIFIRTDKDLPGFFRPEKEWDIVVVSEGKLIATIELKSQVGPSFGNNFNNRAEEAIGNAVDIWTAYREGAFSEAPQPWVGYFFLLEECEKSRNPVSVSESHFPVFPEFKQASYAKRYEILCRKLVLERHYNSACFIIANKELADQQKNYSEPALDLTVKLFLTQLLTHVKALC